MTELKGKINVEVDRRTFVKGMAFAGGAALGLLLSPTPWYLIRDAAFWTQNWSWVPDPMPGEPSFVNAVCGICEGGCGMRIRKIDERLVRIDGNRDHPVNRGSMCPLGTASLQMLYNPARVESPLRRTGGRDSSSWEAVSWEDALGEVAQKIKALRAAQRSHAIACISNHSESTVNLLLERLLRAVGSPNFMRMNTGEDAQDIVQLLMQGSGAAAYDIENARCILSFGCALFNGWGAAGRMYRAQSLWLNRPEDSQVEIIQVDPNLSVTANKSTHWAPIAPGAEAALALGIAHVLIRDELYDKKFVGGHCFGFEDWRDSSGTKHRGFKSEVLARYSPQTVELITRAPVKEIEKLAYRFASNKPALALGGGGRGERFADLYALMAVHSLNALVGSIGRAGGVTSRAEAPLTPLPPVQLDEEARRGSSMPRCDGAGSGKYPFTGSLPHNLDTRETELLFIHEANPYYSLRDQESAKKIFEKIPYIVSLSSHMDESAARADLILPLPTPLERWDDLAGVPGLPYAVYNLNRPLIEPIHDTRNAGDIAMQIARALGGTVADSFPWTHVAEVLRERTRGLYESNRGMINAPGALAASERRSIAPPQEKYPSFSTFWAGLLENGCWFDPNPEQGNAEKSFATPSGKFEFFSRRLHEESGFSDDLKCIPHYTSPEPRPEGFDLVIMPEELATVAADGMGTPPLLIKQLSDTVLRENELFVRINPITAMYQGLKDGDGVILESSRGRVRVRIHTSAGVREGVVMIPLGFGHTAYDRFLRNKGVNACRILEVKNDPISGLPCCWGVPGRIRKA